MTLAWGKSSEILVAGLVVDGKEIISDISLGLSIDKIPNHYGYPLSAIEAQSFRPPTLAELVHAYFGKDDNGDYLCHQYRRSVTKEKETGEWTSTFVIQGKEPNSLILVNRPKKFLIDEYGQISIEYDKENCFNLTSPHD